MGDRGNIIVKDGTSTVYLYTHWCGSNLPKITQQSLKRSKDRWTDGPYLARILFCDMIENGKSWGDTGGYGISSTIGDGGTDILVDVDNQQVHDNGKMVSFQSYVDNGPTLEE